MSNNNEQKRWRFYKKAVQVLNQLFTRDNKKFMTADGKHFTVKEDN